MGYIYKITNEINQKVYIGKTLTSLEKRWKRHIYDTYRSDRTNCKFHNAIKKYGENNFKMELIGQYDNEILNDKEKYYIQLYDSFKNGYNSTLGGDGNAILEIDHNDVLKRYNSGNSISCIANDIGVSAYTISNIIKENNHRILDNITKIVCMDKNFNITNIFCNIYEAYKWYEKNKICTYRNFKYCVKKSCKTKCSAFNYYWMTQDEYLSIKKNNIDLQSVYIKRQIVPSNRIKIKCIDLNIEFESCYKAGEYLFNYGYSKNKNFKSAGQKILNGIRNNKPVYHLIFEFVED